MRHPNCPQVVTEQTFIDRSIPEPNTGCWLWDGAVVPGPYGKIKVGRRDHVASRLSYQTSYGPIPHGFEVDHMCCVPLCVNPAHLRLLTPAQNRARRRVSRTCGHPTEQIRETISGKRVCRACERLAGERYRARKRAATTNQEAA